MNVSLLNTSVNRMRCGLKTAEDCRVIQSYPREPISSMFENGLSYTGTDNANTTTIINVTDIGMSSSGSSGNAKGIWIILMLIVLPIVLPQMKEFMEFIFAPDDTRALEETMEKTETDDASAYEGKKEKTETDEANDEAQYKQREYFIMDTKHDEIFDGR